MNSPYVLQVKAYEGDGLSFITPSRHQTTNVKLDGKDYPHQRPGSFSSVRRVDEHTLEMTDKVDGKVVDTQEIKVSPDGKRLTMTVHAPGRDKPNVMVFDRE
jgi:hypothetical protein